MTEEGYIDGNIYTNKAPEIKLDNWEEFTKTKNNLKEGRSPVVRRETQTTIIHAFVYQGVVYRIEKSKEK